MAGAAETVVHPLHIEAAPSGATVSTLRQVFQEQVLKTVPEWTDFSEVERFLRHRGVTSCWGDDGCIVAMANAVRAKRVLLVSVVRTEPWIIMSARVLDARGTELRNIPITVYTPDADMSEGANFADGFAELFKTLNLSELVQLPTAPKPAPAPASLSSTRIASYAVGGLAVAGVATGITFTALYFRDHAAFKRELDELGVSPVEGADRALHLMQRCQEHKRYLLIGYSVGAAALAASMTLYFLSPEYKHKPVVSFFPQQGGGTLAISTYF